MTARQDDCWRGKGDPTPFVPDLPPRIPRARSLRSLFEAMACCTRCELAPGRTQVVLGTGTRKADVLLLGEAPGAQEDEQGRPFVGASGRIVQRLLEENGLTREEVFITNVVACRPPGNRAPKPREVKAHAPWLEEQLRLVAPRIVVTLGRTALVFFQPKAKITQVRGEPQPLGEAWPGAVLLPTFHPAAALRNRDLMPLLESDFERLGELVRALPAR